MNTREYDFKLRKSNFSILLKHKGEMICQISTKWQPTCAWKKNDSCLRKTLQTGLMIPVAGGVLKNGSSATRTISWKKNMVLIAWLCRKSGAESEMLYIRCNCCKGSSTRSTVIGPENILNPKTLPESKAGQLEESLALRTRRCLRCDDMKSLFLRIVDHSLLPFKAISAL